MCDMLSATILRQGAVKAVPYTMSHEVHRQELGIVEKLSVNDPLELRYALSFPFEYAPNRWRPKTDPQPLLTSDGGWLDVEARFLRPHVELPRAVERSGDDLAKRLCMTEGPVKGLPWITIVRSGYHHLGDVETIVAFGDSEVYVESCRCAWALDNARIHIDHLQWDTLKWLEFLIDSGWSMLHAVDEAEIDVHRPAVIAMPGGIRICTSRLEKALAEEEATHAAQ